MGARYLPDCMSPAAVEADRKLVARARTLAGCAWTATADIQDVRRILKVCAKRIEELSGAALEAQEHAVADCFVHEQEAMAGLAPQLGPCKCGHVAAGHRKVHLPGEEVAGRGPCLVELADGERCSCPGFEETAPDETTRALLDRAAASCMAISDSELARGIARANAIYRSLDLPSPFEKMAPAVTPGTVEPEKVVCTGSVSDKHCKSCTEAGCLCCLCGQQTRPITGSTIMRLRFVGPRPTPLASVYLAEGGYGTIEVGEKPSLRVGTIEEDGKVEGPPWTALVRLVPPPAPAPSCLCTGCSGCQPSHLDYSVHCERPAAMLPRFQPVGWNQRSRCSECQAVAAEPVRDALKDCAVNETNPDTCGVCGKHFADCDVDRRHVGEPDGPEEPMCPGARARMALGKSP